jgi:cyclic beta-1,2-glucan synthetase
MPTCWPTPCADPLTAQRAAIRPLPGDPPRFLLLHRAAPLQRHRAALDRLGAQARQARSSWWRQLATGRAAAFLDLGEPRALAAGTRICSRSTATPGCRPGRLRELVGVAAHPHNQPRLDALTAPRGDRATASCSRAWPRRCRRRRAHAVPRLFAGQCGIDPYSAATSEVYQDLFGEGSFSGKGLLHVQAVHAVLGRRLPEGRVLSHDLLEGALARCAASATSR